MKKTCETCVYNQTDVSGDNVIRNYCFLNPPPTNPMRKRPLIRPAVDFCKEHLAEPLIKP